LPVRYAAGDGTDLDVRLVLVSLVIAHLVMAV